MFVQKKKIYIFIVLFLVLFSVALLVLVRNSSRHVKLRWFFSSPNALNTSWANEIKNIIESESKGLISLELLDLKSYKKKYPFPRSKLKQAHFHEGLNLLQENYIEIVEVRPSDLGKLYPPVWVLDVPFLFDNELQQIKLQDPQILKKLFEGLSSSGLRGMGIIDTGDFLTLVDQINLFDTNSLLKNLYVRTSTSPVTQVFFSELGAITLATPDSIVKKSQKLKHYAPTQYCAQSINEKELNAQFVNQFKFIRCFHLIVMNDEAFQRLHPSLQEIIIKAVKKVSLINYTKNVIFNEQKERLVESGFILTDPTKDQIENMKTTSEGFLNKISGLVGGQIISEF